MKKQRRQFLQAFGITAATVLAGCSQRLDSSDSSPNEGTNETEAEDQGADNDTDPEKTSEKEDSRNTDTPYQINKLHRALQEYENNQATLNFQPADPDAEYANSNIFTELNGEINAELDLSQAQQQRWINNRASNHPAVQRFVEVITEYDEERMQKIHEWYIKQAGGVDLFGLQETIDKQLYTDQSQDLDKRIADSGVLDLWYKIEYLNDNGISSVNNQFQMQALHNGLQQIEEKHGFDTFIWDYGIPGHGLGAAIENPTRKPENTDQQQTYIIETVWSYQQQITKWENSKYSKGKGPAPHPAHNLEKWEKYFLNSSAEGKDETGIDVEVGSNRVDDFIEFFNNPTTDPAYNQIEPVVAAAYIDEENPGLAVKIEDQIEISGETN